MALLPDSLVPLVRTLHVAAGIIWLAGLWLATWFDHKLYPDLKDESWAEFAPRMSAALWPWVSIGAVATVLLGLAVYADMGLRYGFANMAWSVNLGALLAFGVAIVQFAFLVPHQFAVARGSPRPAPLRHRAIARYGLTASALSVVAVVLMVGATRIGGFFR